MGRKISKGRKENKREIEVLAIFYLVFGFVCIFPCIVEMKSSVKTIAFFNPFASGLCNNY